jgi:hypothetical protein
VGEPANRGGNHSHSQGVIDPVTNHPFDYSDLAPQTDEVLAPALSIFMVPQPPATCCQTSVSRLDGKTVTFSLASLYFLYSELTIPFVLRRARFRRAQESSVFPSATPRNYCKRPWRQLPICPSLRPIDVKPLRVPWAPATEIAGLGAKMAAFGNKWFA